jgi:hypothetical protein
MCRWLAFSGASILLSKALYTPFLDACANRRPPLRR